MWWFEEPLLVLETESSQFLYCCNNLWLQRCWRQFYYLWRLHCKQYQFARTSWFFYHHGHHQFSNFHVYFNFLAKLIMYKHAVPKINKSIEKRQTTWFLINLWNDTMGLKLCIYIYIHIICRYVSVFPHVLLSSPIKNLFLCDTVFDETFSLLLIGFGVDVKYIS